MEGAPNVLLVVMDSVRARNTSLHGYERETTPFLETFAEDATVYTQARSPGVGSVASHTSMFTGLNVPEHGMHDVGRRLRPGSTVWDDLSTEGYETGVFSYNSYLTQAPIGIAEAFDTVESGMSQRLPHPEAFDPADLTAEGVTRYLEFLRRLVGNRPLRSMYNGLTMWTQNVDWVPASLRTTGEPSGRVFTELFLDWLDDRSGPWAACLNYMDAHVPYRPEQGHNQWASPETRALMRQIDEHVWEFVAGWRPWEQRSDLEGLYDGCIRQIDAQLERLVAELRQRNLLSETLLIVTADHGEGFAEVGELRPARSLAHGNTGGIEEGILHVPLVVSFPNDRGSARVTEPASLREFPAVVQAVRGGTARSDCFVPEDDPVMATMPTMPEAGRESIPEFVSDPSVYFPGGNVVYRREDDRVRKYVEWNGEGATFDVTDSTDPTRTSEDTGSVVTEAFEPLSESDLIEGTSVKPSAEVEARLEELGYR